MDYNPINPDELAYRYVIDTGRDLGLLPCVSHWEDVVFCNADRRQLIHDLTCLTDD